MSVATSAHGCASCRPLESGGPAASRGERREADPLALVKLGKLFELTAGSPDVVVALIDGPVMGDHPELANDNLRLLNSDAGATCSNSQSFACRHGTFVAGVLAAHRGSPAPAICPECTLLVRPVFIDDPEPGRPPSASPEELADALVESVDAGADFINLSSVLLHASAAGARTVRTALDYAARRGTIVVAAAGNQGTVGGSVITDHPHTIPVIGYDPAGRPIPATNLGHSIGRRGVGAPGDGVTSLGMPGRPQTSGGTSAAAPFVTGTLALLRSLFADVTPVELLSAVAHVRARTRPTVVPPLLDAQLSLQYLATLRRERSAPRMRGGPSFPPQFPGRLVPASLPAQGGSLLAPAQAAPPPPGPEPGALPPDPNPPGPGATSPDEVQTPFIFAIGRIETQFRDMSIEREFAQVMGRSALEGQTDREALASVLGDRQNRYLARQLCYILTIEGVQTYLLLPEVPEDYELLTDAIRHRPEADDVDVVIGVRGPVAPPELCNGLQLPIVSFAQVYSFRRQELIQSMSPPEDAEGEDFERTADELFARISQAADNAGALDEHRAINYLSVRYERIYEQTAEAFAHNQSLTAIEARPSRLTGPERIVDVIFTYTDRRTSVADRYFVRVNVSGMFPFLVSPLQPYFER